MLRRSMELVKAEGYKVAESITTDPFMKKIVGQLGFQEVARLDYKEFIDGIGQPVFRREQLNDDNHAAVHVKIF